MISKRTLLGSLPGGHEVYRIDRVAVLTLSSNESPEFELDVSFETHCYIHVLNHCLPYFVRKHNWGNAIEFSSISLLLCTVSSIESVSLNMCA